MHDTTNGSFDIGFRMGQLSTRLTALELAVATLQSRLMRGMIMVALWAVALMANATSSDIGAFIAAGLSALEITF